MKSSRYKIILAAFVFAIIISSCSSSKSNFCGCPNENGFVGYK